MSKGTEKGLDVRPTGGEGANVARLPGWRMWPPVSSAFVWHDWRPFLVVGSRVGGVEEIAGGQGRLGEVAGFLRAPSPQRASAFQHFLHGLQRWVLLLGRGGRPGGGERSHMALVLFLQSFSRLTAKAPRWRSRIKARSAFHGLREKFLQSRKSSSSSEALFRQCGLCGHGPLSP